MLLALALATTAQAAAARPAPVAKPQPAPLVVLEGVVKDPQNKPVDKALVIVTCRVGGRAGDPPLSARTDAQGRFRFELAGTGPCVVRVEAAGLAPAILEKIQPGSPLSVALEAGRTIEGTVRAAGTGQPVADARVRAGVAGSLPLTWEPASGAVEATTDGKGRYRLVGLGRGTYEVTAVAHGFGRGRKAGVTTGSRVDLVLVPGPSISGTVVGADQKPLAGVVVRAEREDRPWSDPLLARTAAQGRFEMAGVETGAYRLAVWHAGFGALLIPGVEVEGMSDTPVALTLVPGTSVTGRLVDEDARPLAGRVSLQELNGMPVPRALAEVLRAEAGADGRFRLEGVPSGSHALGALAPRHARKRVEFEAASKGADVGDVTLEVGLAIRGRVRDKAGLPVTGAFIRAVRQARMAEGPGFASAEAEADGTFVLAGLSEGTYGLTINAPGYGSARHEADPGAEPVDVVLVSGGAITGLVVDEVGRAVEGFSVDAELAGDRMTSFGGSGRDVATADGRFVLDGLDEGVYILRASAPQHAPTVVSGVKVAAGATTDAGRIRLEPGGVLKGGVTDAEGAPIAGASVVVYGSGERWESGSEPRATTDLDGSFEVRGVPAGATQAVARHPEFAEGLVRGLDVDPAKGPSETRIVLRKGARLEGWARTRGGGAIPNAMVQVWATPEGGGFSGTPITVPVGANGSFGADHIPPGRARVTLLQGSGPRRIGLQSTSVVFQDAETTSVDLSSRETLVSGRVTRGGVPAPRLRVSFRGNDLVHYMSLPSDAPPPSGPQHLTGVAGDDGTYELIVDSPGAYRVVVETVDGRTSYTWKNVDVPDAESWSLDVDVVGSSVTGQAVDKETGAPIASASVWVQRKSGDRTESHARSGADGRFELVVEDGEYTVWASADGYAAGGAPVSVPAPDVRLALSHGGTLKGRIVDPAGRGVPNLVVNVGWIEEDLGPSAHMTMTFGDGSFELSGVPARPCTVLAGSGDAGFAFRSGISPGDAPVVLTLKPGGNVRVIVRAPDGQPIPGVWVRVTSVADAPVGSSGAMTDAQGTGVIAAPVGNVEVKAIKDKLRGSARATVSAGAVAAAEIRLAEPPAASP